MGLLVSNESKLSVCCLLVSLAAAFQFSLTAQNLEGLKALANHVTSPAKSKQN